MSLSQDLVNQFVKITAPEPIKKRAESVNGVYKTLNGKEYVQIDGSDILTPVTSTVEAETGERVKVLIKNHTATVTDNITSPAARKKSVDSIQGQVDEFGNTIVQMDNSINQQNNSIIQMNNTIKQTENTIIQHENTINQQGNTIKQFDNTINQQNDKIESMNNDITMYGNKVDSLNNTVTQHGNNITQINNDITQQNNTIIQQGNTITQQGTKIQTFDSDIKVLNSAFTIKDGVLTGLNEIIVNSLITNSLDAKYANIDFANINMAAVEKLFSESGIIKDLIVQEGHITGELVGVTIRGDLIIGGTVAADKLVIRGSNGLFYKLNLDSLGQEVLDQITEDEFGGDGTVFQNGLHGSTIIAHSITADKVQVTDLVAFGATIGGFHIETDKLYSGVKNSIDNTTRGIYMDKTGQFCVGDSSNFIKYFLDTKTKTYKLDISAGVITLGGSNKTLEQTVEEIQDQMNTMKDEITTNLCIESSRGTVFKNNQVSTVLSVVIYRGSERITNISALQSAMGNGSYLQWKWRRINDESYGIISASDSRISESGFKFSLSPSDIDTQVTFMCELISEKGENQNGN